ncbi:MAG: CopG family ribbon-helix-helix protein [Planctomycetota bacterium]
MATARIEVALDAELLARVDRLVSDKLFANREEAIQAAIRDKVAGLDDDLLGRECAKLDPAAERAMAEEGLSRDAEEWPEY